jgi:8-oxo-dGTP diphosphatase
MTNRGPELAVDCIILLGGKVLLIHRRNPPHGWALPGGFVEYGETVEDAVRREMKEETGLELAELKQFRVYCSRPEELGSQKPATMPTATA